MVDTTNGVAPNTFRFFICISLFLNFLIQLLFIVVIMRALREVSTRNTQHAECAEFTATRHARSAPPGVSEADLDTFLAPQLLVDPRLTVATNPRFTWIPKPLLAVLVTCKLEVMLLFWSTSLGQVCVDAAALLLNGCHAALFNGCRALFNG